MTTLLDRPVARHSLEVSLDPRRDALRDLRVVAPGVIPFGIFLGITISVTGFGALPGVFGAAAVYGGSAQLTTTTVLQLGSGLLAAVAAGVVVNARLLLYGVALAPWFRHQPRWFRLLGPQFLLDQTYLSAVERPGYREPVAATAFRRYWLWLALALLLVWVSSVLTGIVLAPLVPEMPHLLLVGTTLFVAMLVPRLVSRPGWAAAVTGAATACLVAQVAPTVAILAGTATGVLAAVVVQRSGARS